MKYKGIVREIYKYEIEVEASNTDEGIFKLMEFYNSDTTEGVFVAEAHSFEKAYFSLTM